MSENERITDLEMKISHLEMQMEDLNAVVLEQAKMIERLKAKQERTDGKIEELESAKDGNDGLSSIEIAARDKPPHY